TQKQPFRFVFFVTVSLNVVAFVWTLTPSGQATFGQWLSEIIKLF
ncbi:DUF1294 domain-containing protein, partial [Vibrio splendidus]